MEATIGSILGRYRLTNLISEYCRLCRAWPQQLLGTSLGGIASPTYSLTIVGCAEPGLSNYWVHPGAVSPYQPTL
jgi:hypothetical protein